MAGFLPFDLPMTNAQSHSVLFEELVVGSSDEEEAKAAEACIEPDPRQETHLESKRRLHLRGCNIV
jgi:hypothetical protein